MHVYDIFLFLVLRDKSTAVEFEDDAMMECGHVKEVLQELKECKYDNSVRQVEAPVIMIRCSCMDTKQDKSQLESSYPLGFICL
eukprot:3661883-Ditylum_brightwellii.AAC.1